MLFESLKKRSPSQITINIIQIFFNFDLFLLLTHVFHTWHNDVIKSQWSIKLHLQKLETLQNLKTVAITSCKSICLLIPPFGHRSYVIYKLPSLLNLELMTSQRYYHFNMLIVWRQIRIFLLKSILLLLLNFLFAHNKLRLSLNGLDKTRSYWGHSFTPSCTNFENFIQFYFDCTWKWLIWKRILKK